MATRRSVLLVTKPRCTFPFSATFTHGNRCRANNAVLRNVTWIVSSYPSGPRLKDVFNAPAFSRTMSMSWISGLSLSVKHLVEAKALMSEHKLDDSFPDGGGLSFD